MEATNQINNNSNNKESLSSLLNFPSSLNNKENQILFENLKKYEEEKNDSLLYSTFKNNKDIQEKYSINNNDIKKILYEIKNKDDYNKYNAISRNSNENSTGQADESIQGEKEFRKINFDIDNSETKKNLMEKEEILSTTDLVLDEIKLKVDYDKIESELNKLRNNNNDTNNNNNNNDDNDEKDENNDYFNTPNNKNIQQTSLYSNSQIDGDLFYYSEEEENEDDKIKQIKSNNKKIKLIQENLDNIEKNDISKKNNIIKNNYLKTDINYKSRINNNVYSKKLFNKNISKKVNEQQIDKKLLEKIEYGIDETGNPVCLKNNNTEMIRSAETINLNTKKIIAYIITSEEKGNNYLIDLKGNTIPKMRDGDFSCKYNNIRIIIKNFDVQNPKLRVYGARHRFSSIMSEEESNSQITKLENKITSENKHLILLNNIKGDNTKYNTNKFNFLSPVINKNNYYEQTSINREEKNNIYHNLWINNDYNYNSLSEKRNSKNKYYSDKIIKTQSDNLIKRTSFILNKGESRTILNDNRVSNSNIKNIYNERCDTGFGSQTWRNHRTPSPFIKDYIPEREIIKNDTSLTSMNFCKVYKIKNTDNKKCYNNYNKVCKINMDNNKTNNNNIYFTNDISYKKINNNNPYLLQNNHRVLKYCNSSIFNNDINMNRHKSFINNNHLKNTINNKDSNNDKNKILKKSFSSNGYNLTTTINSIANNIKKIENNIKNALQKLMNKKGSNNNINNNNNNKRIMSKFSKNKISSHLLDYNANTNNNKKILKYKSNINLDRNMQLRKIPLNKKYKISTSPTKDYQCTVLSQEANNMIKDFTNKSLTQRVDIKSPTKKIRIYNFKKNNDNNTVIKSGFKIKNISQLKLNKSCDIAKGNEKVIFTKKMQKTKKKINNNKSNEKKNIKTNKIRLIDKKLNDKIIDKNTISSNCSGNSRIYIKKGHQDKLDDKIIPIRNNLKNIKDNIYDKENKSKSKNKILRLKNNAIKKQKNNNFNKIMFSSASTSINSLKDATFTGK